MNIFPSWWWGTSTTKELDAMSVIEQTDNSKDALEARAMKLKKNSYDLLKQAQTETNKSRQLQLLQRKKQYDIQIQQIEGQIANLEQTSNAVMSATIAKDMVGVMKDSSITMKNITDKISVDNVLDITDDLNENMMDVNEIQKALSNPIGVNTIDEDELLKEITSWSEKEDMIKADEIDQQMPSIPTKPINVNNDNNNNNGPGGHLKISLK